MGVTLMRDQPVLTDALVGLAQSDAASPQASLTNRLRSDLPIERRNLQHVRQSAAVGYCRKLVMGRIGRRHRGLLGDLTSPPKERYAVSKNNVSNLSHRDYIPPMVYERKVLAGDRKLVA